MRIIVIYLNGLRKANPYFTVFLFHKKLLIFSFLSAAVSDNQLLQVSDLLDRSLENTFFIKLSVFE